MYVVAHRERASLNHRELSLGQFLAYVDLCRRDGLRGAWVNEAVLVVVFDVVSVKIVIFRSDAVKF